MSSNELSYAEKLMTKKYQFTDMLIRGTDAVECGALSSFIVNNMDHSDKIGNALYLGLNMTYHAIENEIKGINEMIDESKTVEQESKESKEYGFNDVISAAVKAAIDGILAVRQLDEECLSVISRDGKRAFERWRGESNAKDIANFINFIKSLYTETFVIEKFSDTKRLKSGDKAVLGNGEEVIFSNRTGVDNALWFEYSDCRKTIIPFIALKGATVTQQKGNK